MKKLTTSELVKKIEEMRALSASDQKIKEILELDDDVSVILQKFEEEKDFLNAKEVAEILKTRLDNDTYNYHKVLRLIGAEGGLRAEKTSNKIGFRIHIDEVERFIKEEQMTKEDLRKENAELRKQIEELQKQLAAAKEKPKRRTAGAGKEKEGAPNAN